MRVPVPKAGKVAHALRSGARDRAGEKGSCRETGRVVSKNGAGEADEVLCRRSFFGQRRKSADRAAGRSADRAAGKREERESVRRPAVRLPSTDARPFVKGLSCASACLELWILFHASEAEVKQVRHLGGDEFLIDLHVLAPPLAYLSDAAGEDLPVDGR